MRNLDFARAASEAALQHLHGALLAPLAAMLPPEGQLLLVPHGFLHRVPFECLHDGNGYLNERFLISRWPNAEHVHGRAHPRVPPRRKVVIGGLVEDGPSYAAAEIEEVAACFPRSRVRLLRDPSAEHLLAQLAGAAVVHLSTHGTFRGDNPLFSRLSTRGGALFLADLLEQRLDTDLVVLSACATGEMLPSEADGLESVAHGFLAAGARCLVASQWRVHDEATLALMREFYGRFSTRRRSGQKRSGSGVDPGGAQGRATRALREAQRAIRTNWDHPLFWAGFSVFGS
jgi:CHAT domain-containing protein